MLSFGVLIDPEVVKYSGTLHETWLQMAFVEVKLFDHPPQVSRVEAIATRVVGIVHGWMCISLGAFFRWDLVDVTGEGAPV